MGLLLLVLFGAGWYFADFELKFNFNGKPYFVKKVGKNFVPSVE